MESTPEMRRAVARDQCLQLGHRFSEMVEFGRLAPQRVVCTVCGSDWRIHPDDVDKDFA